MPRLEREERPYPLMSWMRVGVWAEKEPLGGRPEAELKQYWMWEAVSGKHGLCKVDHGWPMGQLARAEA